MRLREWRSCRQAYPRCHCSNVDLAHAVGTQRSKSPSRRCGVGDERRDVDPVTRRRERTKALDTLVEQRRRAVEVPLPPMVEADADLQDPVVEPAVGRTRRAPQELEGLVLLEEFALVELLDAGAELGRQWLAAACADRFDDRAAGDALRPAGRLSFAAIRRRALTR
jgi:hypothetical protein